MATYDIKNYQNLPDPGFSGVAYGNMTAFHFHFECTSAGVVVNGTKTTAADATDIFKLGRLPAGFQPSQVLAQVSDAFSADATFDLGFLYSDGVDVTGAAEDADHYFDAGDYHDAVATLYGLPKKYTKLAKQADVVLTNNASTFAATGVMDIWFIGINDSI